MNFEEAKALLDEGKAVRRSSWGASYVYEDYVQRRMRTILVCPQTSDTFWTPTESDRRAVDWEVV